MAVQQISQQLNLHLYSNQTKLYVLKINFGRKTEHWRRVWRIDF
jgi:hypothetical protein